MTWFKVDDHLHDHPKVTRCPASAIGVWVLAGSWSADHLSDGFVPARVLPRWGRRRDAERLVEAGLWTVVEKDGEPGWQFHDWPSYQPTRAEVEAERKANRTRQERFRNRKRNGVDNGVTPSVTGQRSNAVSDAVSNAAPVPSRPVSDLGPNQTTVVDRLAKGWNDQAEGLETIMRKLECDEVWAIRTAQRFEALASGPIRNRAAYYGRCIDDHVRRHGLASLLPTYNPKSPPVCEPHGVPLPCPECEATE